MADEPLRIIGTARDPENNKGAAIYFNRTPTDDELRAIHDSLGSNGAGELGQALKDAALAAIVAMSGEELAEFQNAFNKVFHHTGTQMTTGWKV